MELALSLPIPLPSDSGEDVNVRRWRQALAISIGLHGLALGMVLQHQFLPVDDIPPPLMVVLPRPIQAAPPLAVADREPIRPTSAEHRSARTMPTTPTPEVIRAPLDMSSFALSPAATVSPALPAPAQNEIPAPAVGSPPDPSAMASFNRDLAQAVDRYKHYPRIALMRHWQGTTVLKLSIGADGRVQDYHLARSSGYESLDQQALDMLREALPLPKAPAQLAGIDLSIDIPVVFRIAD